jgi:exopolysaccharide production protein ExoQ
MTQLSAADRGSWSAARAALAEWSLLLAVALALPLAIAAPLGLAPLLLVAAAGVLVGGGWPRRVHRHFAFLTFLLGGFALWGLLSTLWSIDPGRSASMAARLALTFASGALLVDRGLRLGAEGRRRVALALVTGTGFGILVLLFETQTGQALLTAGRELLGSRPANATMLNRAATVLALLLWPTGYALHRLGRPGLAAVLVLAGVSVLSLLENTTAVLAASLGLLVGASALVLPRLTRWAVVAVAVTGILFSTAAVSTLSGMEDLQLRIKPSAVHRLMIWRFTADRIGERPFLGWGLETARELPGGTKDFTFRTQIGDWTRQALPLHPHNAALQVRVELGLIGVAFFAGLFVLLGLILGRVSRDGADRAGHAARLSLITAALTVSMASYGAWQFWWLAAVAIAIAATVAVGLPEPREPDTSDP